MTESKRVCVLSSVHNTFDTRIFHKQARSLVNAGHEVTFFTPHNADETVDGIEIRAQPQPTNRIKRIVLTGRMCREALRDDFDIYHFHDPELLPSGLFLELASSGRVIYDVHEDYKLAMFNRDWMPRPLQRLASVSVRVVERICSTPMSGIIVAADDIRPRFHHHDNVVTVSNFPLRKWAEDTPDPDPPTDGARLVYCGKLSKSRGIPTLIRAVKHIPDTYDVTLSLGGAYVNKEMEVRLKRMVGETERIELLGWLPELADVIQLFRDSTIGMMCFRPVRNMLNGAYRSNKLFQYMSAALPIVVSDVGNWPSVVHDVDSGIAVNPRDPEAIANAVVDMLDDPERMCEMGENGRRAVLDRFNWESEAEKLLEFYSSL